MTKHKLLAHRLTVFFFQLIITLVCAELLIRWVGRSDSEGNFYYGKLHLRPFYLPLRTIKHNIQLYNRSTSSIFVYDPDLGWSPRPESKSANSLYCFNRNGIRDKEENNHSQIKTAPTPGILRIAIFGDSFTQGMPVAYERTWGSLLQQNLKQHGVNAEVLNFGVAGYGIDQAFLRWKKEGKEYHPNIVIYGFSPENVKRNLNILRPLYYSKAEVPFTKPRFVMDQSQLRLINSPTISPNQLVNVLSHFYSHPLARYEYWFHSKDYQRKFFYQSKTISLISTLLDPPITVVEKEYNNPDFYSLDREPSVLALNIIAAFIKDVRASGAQFYIVHLPWRRDLECLSKQKSLPYAGLLNSIENLAPVIHPEHEMLLKTSTSTLNKLFAVSHYNAEGYRIVADALSKYLISHNS